MSLARGDTHSEEGEESESRSRDKATRSRSTDAASDSEAESQTGVDSECQTEIQKATVGPDVIHSPCTAGQAHGHGSRLKAHPYQVDQGSASARALDPASLNAAADAVIDERSPSPPADPSCAADSGTLERKLEDKVEEIAQEPIASVQAPGAAEEPPQAQPQQLEVEQPQRSSTPSQSPSTPSPPSSPRSQVSSQTPSPLPTSPPPTTTSPPLSPPPPSSSTQSSPKSSPQPRLSPRLLRPNMPPMVDLSDLILHSPSSQIVGTPFATNTTKFEYPFPTTPSAGAGTGTPAVSVGSGSASGSSSVFSARSTVPSPMIHPLPPPLGAQGGSVPAFSLTMTAHRSTSPVSPVSAFPLLSSSPEFLAGAGAGAGAPSASASMSTSRSSSYSPPSAASFPTHPKLKAQTAYPPPVPPSLARKRPKWSLGLLGRRKSSATSASSAESEVSVGARLGPSPLASPAEEEARKV
ncbi:hypothetical protein CVT26_002959 [Gymnopilus dilepis]|uniref:Uncharacterized protein n=1 Tax=Gymnopilus dilepis TaxID=231916 RepID=A0A409VR13_9AGAR|nr:hypothetical protein CVT26_002959 [Gymnopilus dilepis]